MPKLVHKIIYFLSAAFIVCAGIIFVFDIFSVGLRMFLFSIKLLVLPVLVLAMVYIAWHIGRFFHKK